mgnify:CR=1 FL=1
MKRLFLFYLLLLSFSVSYAQDALRASTYAKAAIASSKALYANATVVTGNAGAHVLVAKQKKALNNFREEYDNYLSNIQKLLAYAAEIYGLYYEVTNIGKNITELKSVINHVDPGNYIATYYSSRGGRLWNSIVNDGVLFATDVVTLFPLNKDKSKNPRLTEEERYECIRRIRLRLHKMNMEVGSLLRTIKYTTLMDTWYEVTRTSPPVKTRPLKAILADAQKGWVLRARAAAKANSH